MVICPSKEELIGAYNDAGMPFSNDNLAALNEVDAELKEQGLDRRFAVFAGQCRICNYEQTVICPAINDTDNQECWNCGNMTMQERDIPEWEEANG